MAKPLKLPLKKIFTDKCDVYKDDPTTDSLGHSIHPGLGVLLNTAGQLACRILPNKISARGSSEQKGQTPVTISQYTVYIMPFTDPISGLGLNEKWWFLINSVMYNISEVNNPVTPGAPCEIKVERVK